MTTLRLIATWVVDIAGTITLSLLALWGLLIAFAWLRDWIKRPHIGGRNWCLIRFRDDEDRQRTLARMDEAGIDGCHLRDQWYMLKRRKEPGRRWANRLPDWFACALMNLAALISRRVWKTERERDHLVFARLRPDMHLSGIGDGVVFGRGLVRLWVVNGYRHDGWKAARYV